MILVGSRARRYARALATVMIAGIIAMHGMDAGSAHAMAMPGTDPASTSATHGMSMDHAASAAQAMPVAESPMHTGPEHAVAAPVHSMAHECAAVCVLAPTPAHALPEPGEPVTVAGPAAASVVASCAARAPDPPSLTALGVCRR